MFVGVNEIVRDEATIASRAATFITRLLSAPPDMAGNVPSLAICSQFPLNVWHALIVLEPACSEVGVPKFVMVTVKVSSLG
jgi:hypothetical protein